MPTKVMGTRKIDTGLSMTFMERNYGKEFAKNVLLHNSSPIFTHRTDLEAIEQ
jgi:hypothetical protein